MNLPGCSRTLKICCVLIAVSAEPLSNVLAEPVHDYSLGQSIQATLGKSHRRSIDGTSILNRERQGEILLAQTDNFDADFFELLEEPEEEYQEDIKSSGQTEPEVIEPEDSEPVEEIVEQEEPAEPEETPRPAEEDVFAEDSDMIEFEDEPDVYEEDVPDVELVDDSTIEIDTTEDSTPIEFEEDLIDESNELAEEEIEEVINDVTEVVVDEEATSEVLDTGEVEVFGERSQIITPLPGVDFDKSQISTNVQTATGDDIKKSGAINTTQFLNERMQSITVNDNTGNPFQQDVNFRGFSASPLIATPQGVSIYLDGVRVNESFGDVVNWDLIPVNAIDSVALIPGASPLFGLNTLAGALSVSTKTGFTASGIDGATRFGSWGRRTGELSVGGNNGVVGGFFAYNRIREDGWRNNSPSDLEQIFGRADYVSDLLNISVSGLAADNTLLGNGLIPITDFRQDPEQVLHLPTAPSINSNTLI